MSGYHRDGVESDPEGAEESAFNENDEPVDNEYYNFLHVPRNASNEEIGAAYKRLTRLYHPDKHLDEDKKKKADLMFNKLNQIYQGRQALSATRNANANSEMSFCKSSSVPILYFSVERSQETSHLWLFGWERFGRTGMGTHSTNENAQWNPGGIWKDRQVWSTHPLT